MKDMEALGRSFVERTSAKVMLNAVREEGPEDEISTQLQTQNEEVTGEISHSADRTEIDAVSLTTFIHSLASQ